MSSKKSTPKRKPTVASLKKDIDNLFKLHEAQRKEFKSLIENLRLEQTGASDLIWRQFDIILDTLAYNVIFPEPKNRWSPSIATHNYDTDEALGRRDLRRKKTLYKHARTF